MWRNILNRLLDMFSESTITQTILVLTVFGTIAYCVWTDRIIPDILTQYGMIILGFFFGAKSALTIKRSIK